MLAPAAAAVGVRIAPDVTGRCPSAGEIDARWQARAPGGDAAVEIHVAPVGDGLVGVVRVAAPDQPPAARRLRARRDGCSALVDALLTAAALLVTPIEMPRRRVVPPPPAPAEPAPPPTDFTPSGAWRVGLGARGDGGATPAMTLAGELRVERRFAALSLGGALHGGVMPTTAVGAGEVRVERYAGQLHGCWRPGALGICGLGRMGAAILRPDGLDGADATALLVDVGLRAEWHITVGEVLALVIDAELTAPLRRLRLRVDDRTAWAASPVGVGGGLTIEWAL